jgi:hypothetical protein
MANFVGNLKSDGKRAWPFVILSFILDFSKLLLEHRILTSVNEFIDAHSGGIFSFAKPIASLFVQTPFLLLTITICVILLHAYIMSQGDTEENSIFAEPVTYAKDMSQAVSTKQQANPTITVSPVINANPVAIASPTVNIYNSSPHPNTVTRPMMQAEPIPHNVELTSVKPIRTDNEQEFQRMFEDTTTRSRASSDLRPIPIGVPGLKACFLNKSIPGKRTGDLDYVRARLVFHNKEQLEVAETDRPKWLYEGENETVNIQVNRTKCLLIAVFGDGHWAMPFLHPDKGDDLSPIFTIDCQPLPCGDLTAEITLVGEDNVGIDPFIINLILYDKGNAKIQSIG